MWLPGEEFVPCCPTAHPCVEPAKCTAYKSPENATGWFCQVSPPSVVCRILPFPTAVPCWESVKCTSYKSAVVPLGRGSNYYRYWWCAVRPLKPTTKPVSALINHTPRKSPVVPLVCVVHKLPPLSVRSTLPPNPTAVATDALNWWIPANSTVVPLCMVSKLSRHWWCAGAHPP